jgi:hypothetical protein
MTDGDFTTGTGLDPDSRDIEAPAADAVEQAESTEPTESNGEVHRGMEVDDWDAVEQARIVDISDEY